MPQTRAGIAAEHQSERTRRRTTALEYPNGQFIDTDPASPKFGQLRGIHGPGVQSRTVGKRSSCSRSSTSRRTTPTRARKASEKAQAKQDYAASEQNLIVRTVGAYLDVLRSQAVLESTSAEEAAVKRQQEQVQQRFDVGLVAITDVLDATAAYDNVVVRRIQAETRPRHPVRNAVHAHRRIVRTGRPDLDQPADRQSRIDRRERVGGDRARQQSDRARVARSSRPLRERDLRARQAGHLPTIDARRELQRRRQSLQQLAGGQAFLGDRDQYARLWIAGCSCRSTRAASRSRKCAKRARGCSSTANCCATTNGPSAATSATCCAP